MRQALEQFFSQKAYYRLEPEDFQTSVEGALGWACYGACLPTLAQCFGLGETRPNALYRCSENELGIQDWRR
jgi:hypothetical protein